MVPENLLAASGGPRIGLLNVEGWDTHSLQLDTLSAKLRSLDESIGFFKEEIGDANWRNTVVLCVTEFGRTAARNVTGGTDHGIGTVAFMVGGAVNGKQVHGKFPGLSAAELVDKRDLRATSDLRSLFKGVIMDHLQFSPATLEEEIFPGSRVAAPAWKDLLKTESARIAKPA